jgi:serine-type D-Ala-D-Ala carboxypeptidase (penicillin-binding protein 5/6)
VAVLVSAPAVPAFAAGAAPAGTAAASGPTSVRVYGAALANAQSGAMLWTKMPHARRPIGSITKVMTALLVLKAGHLTRQIKVTSAVVAYIRRTGGSNAGLRAGDVLTARQLLEALLVPSGCDAAYLLATAYGPGRRTFVSKMNAMASTLGLTGTHFSNFDGLPIPTEHSTYSTPADLIRLGQAAMRYPAFRAIVAERRHVLAATAQHHRYVWRSTDKMLGHYRGLVGIKTGTTRAAGNCFLFEARRGSRILIGVVLHALPTANENSRFAAARRMLDWGFGQI